MSRLAGTASAQIAAPVAEVWAVVADVERWPRWQATLGALDVLERDGDGRARLCALELEAKVRTIRLRVACGYAEPELTFERVAGDLRALRGRWLLEDLGDGRTRASYELDVDPGRVLGLLLDRGRIERLRELLVDARPAELRARVERS